MRVVLAVSEPPIWVMPPAIVARIREQLCDLDVVEATEPGSRARELPRADVLVTTWLTEAEGDAAVHVRWIHSTAVGVGALLDGLGSGGRAVLVTNSRGVYAEPIAEHAIALTLALRRGLHTARTRQLERTWAQAELLEAAARPLSDATLLVVGLGAIGSRVASFARGLGMRVVGVRRRLELPAPDGVEVLPFSRLRDALPQADAVVLALPTTEETRGLIGRDELELMRPSAVLVNVARGALVDEPALIAALEAGRLAGAGLDAFACEPLAADSPLWRLPNVLVTPHSASFRDEYWRPTADLFLDNMARFRRGDRLLNVVDPARGY